MTKTMFVVSTTSTSAGHRTPEGSGRRHGAAATLAVLALAVAGCTAGGGPADLAAAETRADVEFVGTGTGTGVDGLALERATAMSRLGAGLVASKPGENLVVSPVSILLAFAMLREGASGETADELDAMFAFDPTEPGAAVAELRARLAAHDGDVSTVDRDEPPAEPLLHVADALFAAPDAPISAEFLDRVARFHDAGVFEADFAGGNAKSLLDAWVARETGGLIEDAPSDPDPETRLALLNAVVLAARWLSPFSPEATSEQEFSLASGERVTVDMMVQLAPLRFAAGDGWQAVELPYTSDFAMLLALPAEGQGSLSAAQWDEVREVLGTSSEESQVALWLPRWDFDSKVDLGQALKPLGLERSFEWSGDLDGVFPDAFVSAAAHAATITVAEKGTVAAAVTQLDVAAGSAEPQIDVEMRFDRPFDFQIVSTADQLPIFAGHVADPRG